ncbi:hypothetical protein [Gryllotalpicola protaetiae]|uniref:Uncharacterized protein n=1 Tax=Gryllotalpicola protaetiae TaxID=2419771 RepID=A0A387BKM8_9MICO|nr:hypothetical protein [Gryllotalpicola protaetiae]AYG04705.1 hypothetical protein D7I44_15010 [Gryllotalpicola protaetiae]
MAASSGTVVALVGGESPELISELGSLRNVDAFTLAVGDETDASRRISTSQASYVISDVDPLAHVAAAWVEFFDDRVTLDTLLFEAEAAADALRAGRAQLPDYYLVLDPESVEGTWRHWWFGALSRKAPTRVIPVASSSGEVRRQLRHLPTGRPWPAEYAEWLGRLQYEVPDRLALQ